MIEQLGDFVIKSKLATGGMGTLYLAWQQSLQRDVVVKVLSRAYAHDDEFIARFQHEARSAASLQHPNIIQIYFVGEQDGQHYIAMEYVNGSNLKDYVRDRIRLSVVETLDIIIKTADALDCAANAGIIHRDIKPENIMVTPQGRVKVTDFGLAKCLSATSSHTRAGKILGTVNYMAPEQGLGKETDSRSDIYSLGTVFFELLVGRPPFSGDHPTSIIYMHVYEPPPPVSTINRSTPPQIEELILKMMAKEPENRHQGTRELLDDLEAVRESCGLPVPARRRNLTPSAPDTPTSFEAPIMNPRVPQALVIDPDSDGTRAMARELSDMGFSVLVARDGLQALDMWRTIEPALVVMETDIPKLSGLALLEERRCRHMPGAVLIASARREPDLIRRTAELGAGGYLLKPFSNNRLRERAQSVLPKHVKNKLHAHSTPTRTDLDAAVLPD